MFVISDNVLKETTKLSKQIFVLRTTVISLKESTNIHSAYDDEGVLQADEAQIVLGYLSPPHNVNKGKYYKNFPKTQKTETTRF